MRGEAEADRAVYKARFTRGLKETVQRAEGHAKDNPGKPYPVLAGGPFNEPLEKAKATITYANNALTYNVGTTEFKDPEKFKEALVNHVFPPKS